jgi:hypothetical protein
MRYQRASADGDATLARAVSRIVTETARVDPPSR